MAALLVAIAVMAVLLGVAMPTWKTMVKREKEEELIFRGMQYARAIGLFQRKYAAAYPPDLDTLIKNKFLRKKYKDPMVADGEFQLLYQVNALQQGGRGGTGTNRSGGGSSVGRGNNAGSGSGSGFTGFGDQGSAFGPQVGTAGAAGGRGGILGVASKSTDQSLRIWNGRDHYNEWQFIYQPSRMQPGGTGMPGGMGGQGGQGGRGGRGGGQGGQGGRGMGPGGMGPGGMGGQGGRGGSFQIRPDDFIRSGNGRGPGGLD